MAIFGTDGKRPKVTVTTHKASPEKLAHWRDFVARSEGLRAMRPELIKKYPDKWVAITETNVFIVADSVKELVEKAEELGARPGFSAREFLNTEPRPPMTL